MIDIIIRNINNSFTDISASFLSPDGTYKTPAGEEKKKVDKDLASFHALGRITVLTACGVTILGCLTYSIPILGTLLGTAILITTIALALLSYDLITVALNLETLTSTNTQKIRIICSKTQSFEAKKTQIEIVIVKSAIEKTLILSSLFYIMLATEEH